MIKIIAITVLIFINVTLFIHQTHAQQREKFDITAIIDGGQKKVTASVGSYSYSFSSYQSIIKDSSKIDSCPHTASLTINEVSQDLLRILAINQRINVTILIKDKYNKMPMLRKFEYKDAIFDYASHGSIQDMGGVDEAYITLKFKELTIDGIEIKQ